MKRVLLAVCSVVFAFAVSLGDAQAARLGSGKSVGMQRQAVVPKRAEAPRQATPAQQAAPAPAPAAPGASAPAPKRNWLGPVAGLAAGLGLAALASHFGFGEGLANFLTIALLAMAVVLALKWLLRRKSSATMQYAGADSSPSSGQPVAVPLSDVSVPSSVPASAQAAAVGNVPAGFDSAAFLRVAKANFVRLQTANDAKNLDDIREFVSPEMYAEIKMAIDERGNAPQQTDVVTLDAELLEVVTEGNRHIASVHFSGMLREAAGVPATPFAEVWHLAKPVSGERGWVVAGIQQLG